MFGKYLGILRERSPLIHCITNYVTANDCANLLLACGASPIMSDCAEEVGDVASLSGGLVINTGTLNPERLRAMLIAGKRANELEIPVVLDPVGLGSSEFRTAAVKKLIGTVHFTAIRGNFSEIAFLCGEAEGKRGVDSDPLVTADEEEFSALSERLGSVIIVTGKKDLVTDGRKKFVIHNGSDIMGSITGTGCQLSALTAAFIVASPEEATEAAAAAVCMMGVCGEIAAERMSELDGNASCRAYIIDAAYRLTLDELERRERYEIK